MKEYRDKGVLKVEYTLQDLIEGRYPMAALKNEFDDNGNIIHKCKDLDTNEYFDVVIPRQVFEEFMIFKEDQFHQQVDSIIDFTEARILKNLKNDPPNPILLIEKELTYFEGLLSDDNKQRKFKLPNGETIILGKEISVFDKVSWNYQKIITENDKSLMYSRVSYRWANEDFTKDRAVLAMAFHEIIKWLKNLAQRPLSFSEYRLLTYKTESKESIDLIDVGLRLDVTGLSNEERLKFIKQKSEEYTLGINPEELFDLTLPSLLEKLKQNLSALESNKRKESLIKFEAYLEHRKQMELEWHDSIGSGSILFSISKNSIANIKSHYQLIKKWIKDARQVPETRDIETENALAPVFVKEIHSKSFLQDEHRLKEDQFILDNKWNKTKVSLIAFGVIIWAKGYVKKYHPLNTRKKIEFKDWLACLEKRYDEPVGSQKKRSKILSTFGSDYGKLKNYSPFWLINSLPNSPNFPY